VPLDSRLRGNDGAKVRVNLNDRNVEPRGVGMGTFQPMADTWLPSFQTIYYAM